MLNGPAKEEKRDSGLSIALNVECRLQLGGSQRAVASPTETRLCCFLTAGDIKDVRPEARIDFSQEEAKPLLLKAGNPAGNNNSQKRFFIVEVKGGRKIIRSSYAIHHHTNNLEAFVHYLS